MRRIYLDHAATTPLDERVLDAMRPALTASFANPASIHRDGQAARRLVERARAQVAAAVGAHPRQVVFTGGATEADNHALRALLAPGGGLITSPLEHAAVRGTARALAGRGVAVTWLAPDAAGAVSPARLEEALAGSEQARVVALMQVNNETGVRTDVRAMSERTHAHGALLVVDAVQALGVEEVSLAGSGADVLVLSAHKVNGPKGVGAMVLADGVELEPLLYGGEQEGGRRPGTHNVAAIVGMGEAVALATAERGARRAATAAARDAFERRVRAIEGVRINGGEADRSVKHCNVQVAGVDGEALLLALDDLGVSVSAGSACAAGSMEPSPVLLAMGLDPAAARASVRASFGPDVPVADAEDAAGRFAEAVARCRRMAA